MQPNSEVIGVDVPGGTLAGELIGSPADAVLAVHGISGQRTRWNWLRAAEPGLSLIAPDHTATIMTPTGVRASAAQIAEPRS